MLDTNIWIDFVLIEMKESEGSEIHKDLERSRDISDLIFDLPDEVSIVISEWTLLEFKNILSKYILSNKLIKNGYIPTEFGRGKSFIFLEHEDLLRIKQLVSSIKSRYKMIINHDVDMETVNI